MKRVNRLNITQINLFLYKISFKLKKKIAILLKALQYSVSVYEFIKLNRNLTAYEL